MGLGGACVLWRQTSWTGSSVTWSDDRAGRAGWIARPLKSSCAGRKICAAKEKTHRSRERLIWSSVVPVYLGAFSVQLWVSGSFRVLCVWLQDVYLLIWHMSWNSVEGSGVKEIVYFIYYYVIRFFKSNLFIFVVQYVQNNISVKF